MELKIIFHWYARYEILFKSIFISSVETLMLFKIEEIDAASAKRFMFDIKLLERSFMDIKKVMGLK